MRSQTPRIVLGIIGLLLTILGWHLGRADQHIWVRRLFAPSYERAVEAYDNILKRGSELQSKDPGFEEIAAILITKLHGSGVPQIEKIRVSRTGDALFFGYIGPLIKVTVTLADGQVIESSDQMRDLRPEIKEWYLNPALQGWSSKLFWPGIVISAISLFLPTMKRKEQKGA